MELTKKGNETRKRIVDAALTLFARKGFAATGLRELANEAEVNLAMVNYFFGSKKKLLLEIIDTFFTSYISLVQSHLCGPEMPKKKIRSFIHHATDYFSANRDSLIIVLTELPHDDSEITEYKAEWVRKMITTFSDEICKPLKEIHGIDLPPVVLGPLLVSMMSSRFLFAPMIETVNPPDLKEQFLDRYPELVAEIFLHGLSGLANDTPEGKSEI